MDIAPNIEIRRARDTDREAIWRVHTDAIQALCSGWYGETEIAVWVSRLSPDLYRGAILHRVMFVAERGSEVIGFAQLDIDRREVEAVYVVPDVVRQGVGSDLLRAVEDIARGQGIGRLHLCASLNAEAFYVSHGYRPLQKEQHRLTSGIVLDCIRMDKALAG